MRFVDQSRAERGWGTDALPTWLPWLQIGLSTMVAVLFLVMLARERQQSQTIEALHQRVRGLENSRALDRTTGLAQQMRSMLERLQKLEDRAVRVESLALERQQQLEQALLELRSRRSSPPVDPVPLAPSPPTTAAPRGTDLLPPVPGVPGTPAPQIRRSTGVLKPPGDGRF